MSPIAKKFFIASLVYFILGLLAQTVAVFDVWLGFNPLAYTTATAAGQILFVGWLTQLALALVYDRWLSPVGQGVTLGMVVFVLFNLGLPLVIVGQPGVIVLGGYWLGGLAALGALFKLFAGLIFLQETRNFFRARQ